MSYIVRNEDSITSLTVECPICNHTIRGTHSVSFVFANAGCAGCLANSHPVFTLTEGEIVEVTKLLAEVEEAGRPQHHRNLQLLDPAFDEEDITEEVEAALGL